MTVNVCHKGTQEEDAFDRDFWAGVPPSEKILTAWDMVLEASNFTKRDDSSHHPFRKDIVRVSKRTIPGKELSCP